jgi:hypothetical protein
LFFFFLLHIVYHCGSELGWSSPFKFKAMENGTDWSPRLIMYGDLGNVNAQSLTRLQKESLHGAFDAIIHNGDFAYDMDSVSWRPSRDPGPVFFGIKSRD